MCCKLLPNYCWKFYFLIMGQEGAIQTLLDNLEPWTPTISCPNQTQGKTPKMWEVSTCRVEGARFLGGMCVHVLRTCVYIYINTYVCIWLYILYIVVYNYIYISYVCYSTYGIKSLGFCGSSEMIAISMNRPGCKKPHILDILGNVCCSTCQRTRSQMCLMMLPHKQGLKNANDNFKNKNEASKHL